MKPRDRVDPLSRQFAHRLMMMIESELIGPSEYVAWADALIERVEKPPYWVIELATSLERLDALRAVRDFACSEPFELLCRNEWTDEYIAALYLRYQRRDFRWETFLFRAGRCADSNSGREECEWFYLMLGLFEANEYSKTLEDEQRQMVLEQYADVIDSVSRTYSKFASPMN